MHDIVGRRPEIEALDRWFRGSGMVCLVLEGEAVIGKTTVWAAAVQSIRDSGSRVLMSSPSEAESRLSYAGLVDLLADDLPAIRASLPGPQATALSVAMRLEEPGARPPDETAVARGLLEALRRLARAHGRLLVAIDDVRWLDAPSLAAVAYAARRLDLEDDVKLLTTQRIGASEPPFFHAVATERVRLGPVSIGGIHRIIRLQTGQTPARPRLLDLYAASSGNPLHALELARASGSDGHADGGSVGRLFLARLAALPRQARRAFLLIAASADRSVARLEQAWGEDFGAAIEPAVTAGLVSLAGHHARPVHPLFTQLAYEEADEAARRDVHRSLAATATTSEEHATHLGRAATGPDARAAAEIEVAALEARARGVRAVSGTLFETAARLTPGGATEDRARRILAAASAWFEAGDSHRVETILAPLLLELPKGDQRCEASWRLGIVLDEAGRWQEATALWREALSETEEPGLVSQVRCSLAITAFYTESVQAATAWAAAAVAAAEQSSDPAHLAKALAVQALTMSMSGAAGYPEVIERALGLEAGIDESLGDWSPSGIAAECARHSGDVDAARLHYTTVLRRATSSGDANVEQWAAFGLASTELLAGDFRRASELADTVLDLADQTGVMRIPARSLRAHVDAHLGNLDAARTLVAEAIDGATAAGEATHLFGAFVVLGLIEVFSGELAAAARAYGEARRLAVEVGLAHATALRAFLSEAEAAAVAGELGQARKALATFEAIVSGTPPSWSASILHRARGRILAAGGDLRAAQRELEQALDGADVLPLDRGRALLAFGSLCRRLREYSRARDSLTQALGIFTELGTPPWIERARNELQRIPGRRTREKLVLTDAEARIAELVAAGRSNKDVAAELFLSVKTIEVTLTRVYEKLGVHSRAELAAVSGRPPQG